MKKILAWVLCAIMLISAVPAVLAEGDFTVTVDSVNCAAGDKDVEVAVYVENNPGFFAIQLEKVFPSELKYTGSDVADSLIQLTDTYHEEDDTWGENILVESLQQTTSRPKKPTDYTADGDIVYLYFDIPDDAVTGDYTVSFNVLSANNYALQYLTDAITVVPGTIHVDGADPDASLEVGDYKGDRDQADWLVPTETGKVFAGWYADDAFTTVYTETTGKAYPKFVDEKVMEVMAQKFASSDTTKATLRFVSTLDALDYQKAGFEITFGSKTVLQTIKNVYQNVSVEGTNKTPAEVSGSAESQYITLFKLTNIPAAQFDADFSVRAYWQTPDGTAVYSNTAKVVNVNMF